jgi:peptidoglycan-N-acetylglucosamine deacetylase
MNRRINSLLGAVCLWLCVVGVNLKPTQLCSDLSGGTGHDTTTVSADAPGEVIRRGPGLKKEVALTFDDGPDNRYTPEILDILQKNGVPATFFVIGMRAKTFPQIVKRIDNEGHAIGNHTWNHRDLLKLSPEQIRIELSQTDEVLNSIVGYYPSLFRPPYGAASTRVIKEVTAMGYKVIDWSIDTRDWAGTPTPTILQYVQKDLYPGGIILEHCAGGDTEDLSNTVRALPQIISTLKAKGYAFVTVPQLLNIPGSMDSYED